MRYSASIRAKVNMKLDELNNRLPEIKFGITGDQLLQIAKEMKRIELERDIAIETKAEINDKKVATSMNTASQLSKKVQKLGEEIGFNKKYATIKRMEIATKRSFRFKPLKDYCKRHELDIKKVSDVNYGYVNAYPADAWYDCYDIDLEELFD